MFGGQALAAAMRQAAGTARNAPRPTDDPWYDDTVFSRGGWRVLLLATCSPLMQTSSSFEDVRGLVEG